MFLHNIPYHLSSNTAISQNMMSNAKLILLRNIIYLEKMALCPTSCKRKVQLLLARFLELLSHIIVKKMDKFFRLARKLQTICVCDRNINLK